MHPKLNFKNEFLDFTGIPNEKYWQYHMLKVIFSDLFIKRYINQSGHGEQMSPPSIFKIALKIYFISIPSDYGLGTENPRSLGIQGIFAIFFILFF